MSQFEPEAAVVRPPRAPGRARSEHRRRERHFRRRRRDLLEDALLGLVLAIVLISLTAGLGVLALIVLPVGLALIAAPVMVRLWRWRKARRPPRVAQRRSVR